LTKQGQSFSPYRCIVTIQNEDGLTVYWKALKHSESFNEIKEDLDRLRKRLNRNKALSAGCLAAGTTNNPESVKVVYVDNCCNVCNTIKACYPGADVKLDAFHWLKRWNDILCEPTSVQGGIFRALMSRAIFNVEASEFKRAKEHLVNNKKKPDPSVREILREANSVIPDPNILRQNVEAVLQYIRAKDTASEQASYMLKVNPALEASADYKSTVAILNNRPVPIPC
jgi:hypothetical protein